MVQENLNLQQNQKEGANLLMEVSELRKAVEALRTQSGLRNLRNDPRVPVQPEPVGAHPLAQFLALDTLAPSTNPDRPQPNQPLFQRNGEAGLKSLREQAVKAARAPNSTWEQQLTATILEYYPFREALPPNYPNRAAVEAGANMHMTRIMTNIYGATEFLTTLDLYVKFLEDHPNAREFRDARVEAALLADARTLTALMPYWARVMQIHFLSYMQPPPAAPLAEAVKQLQQARNQVPADLAGELPTAEQIGKLDNNGLRGLMSSISAVEGRLRNIVFAQTAEVRPPRHHPTMLENILKRVTNEGQRKNLNNQLAGMGLAERHLNPIPARRVHAAYINILVDTRRSESEQLIKKAGVGEIPPNLIVDMFRNHREYGNLIMQEHLFGLQTVTAHMYAGTNSTALDLQQHPNPEMRLKMFTAAEQDKIFADFLQLMAATPQDPSMQKAMQEQREKSVKAMQNYLVYMQGEALQLRIQLRLVDQLYVRPEVTKLTEGINFLTNCLEENSAIIANWTFWGPILAGMFPRLRVLPFGGRPEEVRKRLEGLLKEEQQELAAVQALDKTIQDTRDQLEKSEKALLGPLGIITAFRAEDVTNRKKVEEAQAAIKAIAAENQVIGKTVVNAWNNVNINMERHAKTTAELGGAQNSLLNVYTYLGTAFGIVLMNYIHNRIMSGGSIGNLALRTGASVAMPLYPPVEWTVRGVARVARMSSALIGSREASFTLEAGVQELSRILPLAATETNLQVRFGDAFRQLGDLEVRAGTLSGPQRTNLLQLIAQRRADLMRQMLSSIQGVPIDLLGRSITQPQWGTIEGLLRNMLTQPGVTAESRAAINALLASGRPATVEELLLHLHEIGCRNPNVLRAGFVQILEAADVPQVARSLMLDTGAIGARAVLPPAISAPGVAAHLSTLARAELLEAIAIINQNPALARQLAMLTREEVANVFHAINRVIPSQRAAFIAVISEQPASVLRGFPPPSRWNVFVSRLGRAGSGTLTGLGYVARVLGPALAFASVGIESMILYEVSGEKQNLERLRKNLDAEIAEIFSEANGYSNLGGNRYKHDLTVNGRPPTNLEFNMSQFIGIGDALLSRISIEYYAQSANTGFSVLAAIGAGAAALGFASAGVLAAPAILAFPVMIVVRGEMNESRARAIRIFINTMDRRLIQFFPITNETLPPQGGPGMTGMFDQVRPGITGQSTEALMRFVVENRGYYRDHPDIRTSVGRIVGAAIYRQILQISTVPINLLEVRTGFGSAPLHDFYMGMDARLGGPPRFGGGGGPGGLYTITQDRNADYSITFVPNFEQRLNEVARQNLNQFLQSAFQYRRERLQQHEKAVAHFSVIDAAEAAKKKTAQEAGQKGMQAPAAFNAPFGQPAIPLGTPLREHILTSEQLFDMTMEMEYFGRTYLGPGMTVQSGIEGGPAFAPPGQPAPAAIITPPLWPPYRNSEQVFQSGSKFLTSLGARRVQVSLTANREHRFIVDNENPAQGLRCEAFALTRTWNGGERTLFFAWDGAMWYWSSWGGPTWEPVTQGRYQEKQIKENPRLFGYLNYVAHHLTVLARDAGAPRVYVGLGNPENLDAVAQSVGTQLLTHPAFNATEGSGIENTRTYTFDLPNSFFVSFRFSQGRWQRADRSDPIFFQDCSTCPLYQGTNMDTFKVNMVTRILAETHTADPAAVRQHIHRFYRGADALMLRGYQGFTSIGDRNCINVTYRGLTTYFDYSIALGSWICRRPGSTEWRRVGDAQHNLPAGSNDDERTAFPWFNQITNILTTQGPLEGLTPRVQNSGKAFIAMWIAIRHARVRPTSAEMGGSFNAAFMTRFTDAVGPFMRNGLDVEAQGLNVLGTSDQFTLRIGPITVEMRCRSGIWQWRVTAGSAFYVKSRGQWSSTLDTFAVATGTTTEQERLAIREFNGIASLINIDAVNEFITTQDQLRLKAQLSSLQPQQKMQGGGGGTGNPPGSPGHPGFSGFPNSQMQQKMGGLGGMSSPPGGGYGGLGGQGGGPPPPGYPGGYPGGGMIRPGGGNQGGGPGGY